MFNRFIYFALFMIAIVVGTLASLDLGGELGRVVAGMAQRGEVFLRHALPILAFTALMKYCLKR